MGKKTEKGSKHIGYQDIRRLFGRATQATQATPAAAVPAARQRQSGAPPRTHVVNTAPAAAPAAPAAPAAQNTHAAKAAKTAGSKAAGATARGEVAGPAAGASKVVAKAPQKPAAPAAQQPKPAAANPTAGAQQREKEHVVPAQQQQQQQVPAQAGQKRPAVPSSAAEAAAAHAAKAAAARAAKAQAKEAAAAAGTTGNRASAERSTTPAAGPGLSKPAAAAKSNGSTHTGSRASGAGPAAAGIGQGASSIDAQKAACAGAAAAGSGQPASRSSKAAAAATGATAGRSRAQGSTGTAAANSRHQHRPSSALFSTCMGMQACNQMVMSQYEDLPEVQWEPSPPKLALLHSTAQHAAGAAGPAGSTLSGAASAGGSGRDSSNGSGGPQRSKSRSKSPTPVSMHTSGTHTAGPLATAAVDATAAAKGSGRQEGRAGSSMDDNRRRQGSGQSGLPSSKQAPAAPDHKKPSSRPDSATDDSDPVLQQVLASIPEACPAPSVLATPGGPRLRAFRQACVLPPSSGGGSSCRKLQRQQRRSSASTGTGLAAAAAADSAADTPHAAGTGRAEAGPRTGSGALGSGSTGGAVAATPGSSTGKKQQAGVKRKVLMELLDKVQDLVKKPKLDGSSSSAEAGADGSADAAVDEDACALPVFDLMEGLEGGVDDAAMGEDEGAAAAASGQAGGTAAATGTAAGAAAAAGVDAEGDAVLEAVLAGVCCAPASARTGGQPATQQQPEQQPTQLQQPGKPQGQQLGSPPQHQQQEQTKQEQQAGCSPAEAHTDGLHAAATQQHDAATLQQHVAAAVGSGRTQQPVQQTRLILPSSEQQCQEAAEPAAAAYDTKRATDTDMVEATQDPCEATLCLAGTAAAATAAGPTCTAAGIQSSQPQPATTPEQAVASGAGAGPTAAAAAEANEAATAAAAGVKGVMGSQEGRARAAVKELEDFELLYGDVDELLASQTASQQQQQQQQQQMQTVVQEPPPPPQQQQERPSSNDEEEDFDILEAVLADIELPAAKSQRLQQQQQQPAAHTSTDWTAAPAAAGTHAAAIAAAAQATGTAGTTQAQNSPAVDAAHAGGATAATAAANGGLPTVPLAGGRAEVHHEVLEAVHGPDEVLLRCVNPYKGAELWVHLSNPWCDCSVSAGDKANIMGGTRTVDAEGRSHAYLDHTNGMFVLHPDVLLSGTAITTALSCVRRAWLSERFAAAGGGPGAAATRGTLLHELLQRLLVEVVGADADAELPGVQQLEHVVTELLAASGEKLHEVGLTEQAAAQEMNKHLANISAWLRQYLPQPQKQQQQQQPSACQPQQAAQQAWHQGQQQQQQPWQNQRQQPWQQQQQPWQQRQQQQQQVGRQLVMQQPPPWQQQQAGQDQGGFVDVGPGCRNRPRVVIHGVADIEENIWAPRYGLKGQLDASLLVQLTQPDLQAGAACSGGGASVWGSGQPSGGSSWAGGSSGGRGGWQQQQQQQGLGSGFSVGAGASGGAWQAGASGGCSQASGSGGGPRQQQEWQQWQQWHQQQQQQQARPGGRGSAGSTVGQGILAQVDLNQMGAATAAHGSGGVNGGGTTGMQYSSVVGATAAAPAGNSTGGDAGVKAYKGRVSGAAAAIRAYKAGHAEAAVAVSQQPDTTAGQQQQQQGRVRSLASGGSNRPPAAASGGSWGGRSQGADQGSRGSGGLAYQQQQGQQQQQQQQHKADSELLIVPFEFKTGKDYFSHKAQVSLYLLLMEVRYQLGLPPAGLLWNVNSQNMTLVPAKQEELSSLLSCRNRVAAHLWQECPTPPAMLGDSYTCGGCHSAATCAAVHAVLEGGNASSSGMEQEQWQQLAGGVSAAAAAWGSKWVQLLDWEESGGRARRSEVWALTGAQRQARGGCIAGLHLVETSIQTCSPHAAALAAAAAAAQGDDADDAELAAVVATAATPGASLQAEGVSAGPKPAAAAAAAAGGDSQAAAEEAAGAEKLYLYTFEQQAAYQRINTGRGKGKKQQHPEQQQPEQQQHTDQQQSDFGAEHTSCGKQSPPLQKQQQPVDKSQQQAGQSSSGATAEALQGIAASPGEMLLLSADGLQVNIGRVDVVKVSGSRITMASRKDLQLERYQAAAAAPAAAGVPASSSNSNSSSGGSVLWRLDQDEAASIGNHQRAVVLRLAAESAASNVQRLRELIIDLAVPRLREVPQSSQGQQRASQSGDSRPPAAAGGGAEEDSSKAGAAAAATTQAADAAAAAIVTQGDSQHGPQVLSEPFGAAAKLAAASCESYLAGCGAHLNSSQVSVLHRVMAMQDYCLVLGMPGTGKTSTIMHAIRALVSSGASVLVAAYTNSALDNILLKLAEAGVHQFLRLGRASSCHAKIREYMPGGQRYPHRSTSELQQLAASTPIVGCPCLSAHHPLLATRPPFDVVIVDEAGQITTPAVLPALLRGRSFVLVGDHHQLPPLVLDPRAQAGGLGVSLFRQLCEAHPNAVVKLQQQYRMAGPIMALANALVYKGQLQSGGPAVEDAQLQLPRPAALQQMSSWVSAALDPSVKLAFLDTDGIQPAAAAEDCVAPGGGVVNLGEALVVMQLLSGLLAAGVPGGDIGIISPYKAQVNHLQKLVESAAAAPQAELCGSSNGSTQQPAATAGTAASEAGQVEVLTIDRCQGRDKSVVLLSFVRSNAKGATGNLLADAARLNVAITRAKVKLLMVGSASRLRAGVPLLAQLLDWAAEQGSTMKLPADAVTADTGCSAG